MDDERDEMRRSAAHVFADALGDTVDVDDETLHHLDRVLRLRDGEVVTVADGAGGWCTARIVRAGGLRLERDGAIHHEVRRVAPLTVATAIPKGDRLEWMVQKATELGVDRIQLLHCDRSVVRWQPERVERRLERLRRVAEAAGRQSRRLWAVEVAEPVASDSVLGGAAVAEPGGRALAADDATVAVGPEGGWSDRELGRARTTVDLGPTILRTETAVLAAAVLVSAARRVAGT